MLDRARMRGRRYGESGPRERYPRDERFRRGDTHSERRSREAKAQRRDERRDQEDDRYADRDVPAERIVEPLEMADRRELFGDFHCDEQAEAAGPDREARQQRADRSQASTDRDERIDATRTTETDRNGSRDDRGREDQSDHRDGSERRVRSLAVVIACRSTHAIDEIDEPVCDEGRHARREEPRQPAQENRHVTTFS